MTGPSGATSLSIAQSAPADTVLQPIEETPRARVVDLELSASGAMRPGTPVRLRVSGRARWATANTQLELVLLDDDSVTALRADRVRAPREKARDAFARTSRGVGKGASIDLDGVVRFDRPGYYRVLARAASTVADSGGVTADTAYAMSSYEILHLLVDEGGGKAERTYDHTVAADPARVPLFGSFGVFRKRGSDGQLRPRPANGVAGNRPTSPDDGIRPMVVQCPPDAVDCGGGSPPPPPPDGGYTYGRVVYNLYSCPYERDTYGCSNYGLRGVRDARVTVNCNTAQYATVAQVVTRTSDNGDFAVFCPSGTAFVNGNAALENGDIRVSHPNNSQPSYAVFQINFGEYASVLASNDYHAHAYNVFTTAAARARAKFAGYSRAQLQVYLNVTDASYKVRYCSERTGDCPTNDVVTLSPIVIFDDVASLDASGNYGQQDPTFVMAHEYGHAFHYQAIDYPRSYDCRGIHNFGTAATHSCGFVEGFADFFAAWIMGSELRSIYENSVLWAGDYGIELNRSYWLNGNGGKNEAAVASLLYDLVDGPNEPDSPSNTANGDEWFDTQQLPGAYIAKTIRDCRWTSGSLTSVWSYTKIDGIDELMYCLERSFDAQSVGPEFRVYDRPGYGGVTYYLDSGASTPPGWNRDAIRRLWRYNLFGVAP